MAKSDLRLLLLSGPGKVETTKASIFDKQWSLLVNASKEEALKIVPQSESAWLRKHQESAILTPFAGRVTAELTGSAEGGSPRIVLVPDERRPGRSSCLVETPEVGIAVFATPQVDAPVTKARVVILDASWTHIPQFPDREEVREAFVDAMSTRSRKVWYVTNLNWDAELFDQVARETDSAERTEIVRVDGFGPRMLWQVREAVPKVHSGDLVLLGLVPRRDDRGAYQRLRSDFAEQTEHVRAYPVYPVSLGPGAARDEALEITGLWLPTRVLIAGGPLSEQVLLARHLEENAGGTVAVIGEAAAEYRLPTLTLSHHVGTGQRPSVRKQRSIASRSGLVVITYRHGEEVTLVGTGLPKEAQQVLPRIRISGRGRTAEQMVHDVETSFSSRGMPVPAIRFLP